jgi:hypothetical protein
MFEPGYWMNETSGVLRAPIMAYLQKEKLTPDQIELIKAYICQWIYADVWLSPKLGRLRKMASAIDSEEAIDNWLTEALCEGIDPF